MLILDVVAKLLVAASGARSFDSRFNPMFTDLQLNLEFMARYFPQLEVEWEGGLARRIRGAAATSTATLEVRAWKQCSSIR